MSKVVLIVEGRTFEPKVLPILLQRAFAHLHLPSLSLVIKAIESARSSLFIPERVAKTIKETFADHPDAPKAIVCVDCEDDPLAEVQNQVHSVEATLQKWGYPVRYCVMFRFLETWLSMGLDADPERFTRARDAKNELAQRLKGYTVAKAERRAKDLDIAALLQRPDFQALFQAIQDP